MSGLAVHLTEAVMQQHVGRAWRRWRGIGSDDAVECEGCLDRFVFETAIEKIGRARREQFEQETLIGNREIENPAADASSLDQFENAAAGVWRRGQLR